MSAEKFYVIDLFAGCGGLSEGFRQAGFEIIAQVEMNKWCCETLSTRHLYYLLKENGKGHLYRKYLKEEISREDIFNRFPHLQELISYRVIQATLDDDGIDMILKKIEASRKYHGASRIHILLGGPPCQPYSIAGRARDPSRMENDERHYLYRHYLAILEYLKPDFFLYENVPGLVTAKTKGEEIFARILRDFSSLTPPYEIIPPIEKIRDDPHSYILDSKDFYIPQSRKRIFLIGYRKSPEFENPEIKEMFRKLQMLARRNRKKGGFTVRDAIGDLPPLKPGQGSDGWLGCYNHTANLKPYQLKMRRDSSGVLNHGARTHMESDLERYRFFIEHHKNGKGTATLNDLISARRDLTPNHRHLDKFLDRFKVQWWDFPSSTITAHICKDGHYYIHPDITQCRSFTVREAARCQSFPDNFKFEGPRTEQFRQVGNAVTPLLAGAIGRYIHKELEKIYDREIQSGE